MKSINYTKSITSPKQKILKFFILIRSTDWETFKARGSSWECIFISGISKNTVKSFID